MSERSAPPTKVLHHGRRRSEYEQQIQAGGGGATVQDLLPTRDEKDALAGTSGKPSQTNKYATGSDTRLADQRDAKSLQGRPLTAAAPAVNDVVTWDGAQWKPAAGGGGGGGGQASPDILRAASTADLVLGVAAADIAGATVTLTKAGLWLIIGVFDLEYSVAGSTVAVGRLMAGGVAQTPDASYRNDDSAVGRASITSVWKYTAAVNDVAKLQALKTVAAATITAKNGQCTITAVFIGGLVPIWEQIWEAFDGNADPVDKLIQSGAYRVFIFFGSHNAATWKAATNATYAVPAGKKLIVLTKQGSEALTEDTVSRQARFRNATDAVDVLAPAEFQGTGAGFLPWGGDLANPSKLTEVAAGKTVRLELWNADAQKRALGALVICREV